MKKRIIATVLLLPFFTAVSLLVAYNLHILLSGGAAFSWRPSALFNAVVQIPSVRLFFALFVLLFLVFLIFCLFSGSEAYYTGSSRIIPEVTIPEAAGHGEYGTAHFASKRQIRNVCTLRKLDPEGEPKGEEKSVPGGVLLGWQGRHKCLLNTDDTHTLIIGATRCGKTRCNVLPSIILQAFSGESIIAVDPKGELYGYTSELLHRLGYEVICIDFKNPARSNRYNFLQPVLDAVLLGNVPLAVQRARDIASMLVPDGAFQHTDPIWLDGQRSALTASILAVCLECQDPLQQNLSNARAFLANMCAPRGSKSKLPLELYLKSLPPDSPLMSAMAIAQIAPSKMRGSFYTSALTTLELFSDPYIQSMSSITDFDYAMTGNRKRAIFLILPDERGTYYPLASLFVYEQYQALVAAADARGGRLPRRVNFVCDEFGNFVKIPDFDKFVTVGGGRGMRFHLYVQDTGQLYEKYGDKPGHTISSNCETWIYLQTDNTDTLEELSKRLGSYTIRTPNQSSTSTGSTSGGYGLTGRRLLMPEEISKIGRPYQLVFLRNGRSFIARAPDIAQTPFNAMLGMGDKAHNITLLEQRLNSRPEQRLLKSYWNVWLPYIQLAEKT